MASSEGFSLVEALVALAILGAVGSTTAMLMGSNDRRVTEAVARHRAAIVAESVLNRVGLDLPLKNTEGRSNDQGGLHYAIKVEGYETASVDQGRSGYYLVTVAVSVQPSTGTAPIELLTLRPVHAAYP